MLKSLVAFPILNTLSRIAGLVGTVGKLLPIHKLYEWLFDQLIGLNDAKKWRDDHMRVVADAAIEREDAEVEESCQELVQSIVERRRKVEMHFSDGESVLSLGIALAAFMAEPWVASLLAILLVISVSVRFTAIQALAYDNPNANEDPEWLFAQSLWNGRILAGKNVVGSLISLRIMREISESLYERWLHEVFAPALLNLDKLESIRRMYTICLEEFGIRENSEGKKPEEDGEDNVGEDDGKDAEEIVENRKSEL